MLSPVRAAKGWAYQAVEDFSSSIILLTEKGSPVNIGSLIKTAPELRSMECGDSVILKTISSQVVIAQPELNSISFFKTHCSNFK